MNVPDISRADGSVGEKPRARKQVFVAYSYKLYPKDDYRKVFKELEEAYDVTFIFADEKITNMHIMKKIESFIRNSDFSIYDISGWNPNVTLELGFAMSVSDQWYIAIDPSETEINEVPSDLRGLDRIEYHSYSEYQAKLNILLEQQYPKRKPSGITEFLFERKNQILELLASTPGLKVDSIAKVIGIDIPLVQFVVQPMIGNELETTGRRRGTKYYLRGTIPSK